MTQQLNELAMDPFRFADDLRSVSPGKDPWSDARVAIGQFTAKLVGAFRRQSMAANPFR
jgi:hypothetical protein